MSAEREYRFPADKSAWGEGPWQNEPDKVVWVDDTTGLDCMIVRNHGGALCGYVGVPVGHPWHGMDYDALDVEVHGGLTFAGPCMPNAQEHEQKVCHSPVGRPDNVWWQGFDTAHGWDYVPGYTSLGLGRFEGDVYRDMSYVRREVESLARQAVV